MKKKCQSLIRWLIILIIISVGLGGLGCDATKKYVGTYGAVIGESVSTETVIKLRENGQGIWTIKGNEVSFRWSVKGNEIRFHTREGGVIIGKIGDNSITLALPGNKVLLFKKTVSY